MTDPALVTIVMVSFALAGLVKGVVGLGLPTVSLGILSLFVDLPTAMVLLIMPSLCTNIWQALAGGGFRQLVWRLWPFLLAAILMVHVGGALFTQIDVAFLERCLGVLLLLYAVSGLVGRVPHIVPHRERLIGIACGGINGLLTGLTGTLFVPGVMFLQALNLPRDRLVQAMGMLFAVSTASLGMALFWNGLILPGLGALSGLVLLPALAGMYVGQVLRQHVSEGLFRRLFLIALGGLGLFISLG